jgi:superfamily II DNA or RNA helicase
MTLLERLYKLVKEDSHHKGSYYASKLGHVTRRQVNRCLYSNACFFNLSETDRPAWKVVGPLKPTQPMWVQPPRHVFPLPIPTVEPPPTVSLPEKIYADAAQHLSGWQKLAYKNWVDHCRRGIVEAVTGAGKTRVGIAAIKEAVAFRRRSVVVVPSIVLQQQWHRELKKSFPNVNIGLFGGEHRQATAEITIAVVNGLATDTIKPNAHFKNTYLIVADEVHRYGARIFARALLPCAAVRLGLTATLERTDDGVSEILLPYFGATVYNCGFSEARNDGRLAPATIALLGIRFNNEEQELYDHALKTASYVKSKLVRDYREELRRYGFKNNDTDLFFVAAQRLAAFNDIAGRLALAWLRARSETSHYLANATGKRTAARTLSGLFGNGHSGIVFCQRIAAADELCKLFSYQQLKSAALYNKISHDRRKLMLQQLSDGRLDVLTTAIALDEGIDVPNIDTGIIISSTQQKRQMIQRLGRVLRVKPDGRHARVVITYALGTWEDPAVGKKRAEFATFAADATGDSGAYKDFKQDWNVEKVRDFFAD